MQKTLSSGHAKLSMWGWQGLQGRWQFPATL